MKRYHIIVSGEVQGVGFRFFVYEIAAKFSLTGWVRNLYDGTVEVEVQGDEKIIMEFIERLRVGSRFSTVEDVEFEVMNTKDNEKAFRYVF